MGGSADVRPLLETLRRIDPVDMPKAWDLHKQKLRVEFSKHQDAAKSELDAVPTSTLLTGVASILGKLVGRGIQTNPQPSSALALSKSPNLVDIIENAARTERASFLKEQEANKSKLVQMQKEHEEMIRAHLEDNKKKNLKLFDYLMGAGQMQAPVSAEAQTMAA